MGIIGYELIYEATPFHDENVHETYSKILSYCDDSSKQERLIFPNDVKISPEFRSLLEGLIVQPKRRLGYSQIIKHEFFKGINWDTLRQSVPPIIPNVNSDDDISNFEYVERSKERHDSSTSSGTFCRSNDFSGKDLPFLGYGFIHEEKAEEKESGDNKLKINKLNTKISELQKVVKEQANEIRALQEKLLKAEQHVTQSDSLNKILRDAKDELNKMKDKLKEKTIELAATRTEIKTLQSSLKIEEEMRLKSDATISEVLSSTYQKWEKAKLLSDQNYEKQIAEKKTEISNIAERLKARESELSAKVAECAHLQEKVESYKDMLKSIKEKGSADKIEFDKSKQELTEAYENKILELQNKLKMERESRSKLTTELRDVRSELDESICSTNSNKQVKIATEKNIEDMKQRLNKEVEINKNLRSENAELEKRQHDIEKVCENLKSENERMRKELQLIECSKKLESDSALSSPYRTAYGSLADLQAVEDQLRSDLLTAKENENVQRRRADQLEEVVGKLEEMITKLNEQPKIADQNLEKRNEKLEDKLAEAREQAVIERQSARTANLSLWKMEKQVEDIAHEKKLIQRRMELTEEKIKKVQSEKFDVEKQLKSSQITIKEREEKIIELKGEIADLKANLQKEHKMWEKAEQERMKEKSDVIEYVSQVHKLKENIEDYKQRLHQASQKSDALTIENKRLLKEVNEGREKISSLTDKIADLELKLKGCQDNYEMLKMACNITDTQLSEIEVMLETEVQRNKANMEKIDNLYKSVREKDDVIAKLKLKVNEETANKNASLAEVKKLHEDIKGLRNLLEKTRKDMITQQQDLIDKSSQLFEAQEKIELLSSESANLQAANSDYCKEITVLKEENSRILTDLFMAKEETNTQIRKLKEATQTIAELKQNIELLNGTLAEQKNYYVQRDIKSEATLMQHKKLIDYLQLKVEDLSQKKKKSLADKIFGTGTTLKKENVSPNAVESSIIYRTLQEELKREKQRVSQLREQLEQAKLRSSINKNSPIKNTEEYTNNIEEDKTQYSILKNNAKSNGHTDHTHRFELNLESSSINASIFMCIACNKQILTGSPYWRCKECKGCVHRKCRSDVQTPCGAEQIHFAPVKDPDAISSANRSDNSEDDIAGFISEYHGDLILTADITSPPLEINCIFELSETIILLGCNSGLFAYHLNGKKIINIRGVDTINYIAVTRALSKAIFIGSNGECLYQCCLRHLQSRCQSCLKPSLEVSALDLPFANRTYNERWHLVKISDEAETTADIAAIAATSTRIVILKYDLNLQRFKPVRALDTATAVTSILFTRHTAIVSSDKFFEIDLSLYSAEEFVDMSDVTLVHTSNCQPLAVFRISMQEFLLCFTECGIFVDEYGCRSRPYDLNWEYTPTGFLYQEPLLYITHFQIVQVMRIHRSYRKEVAQSIASGDEEEPNFVRTYLQFHMPSGLAECGERNAYLLAINKDANQQEVYILDGVKAFRENTNISLETLSSQATCVTVETEPNTDAT